MYPKPFEIQYYLARNFRMRLRVQVVPISKLSDVQHKPKTSGFCLLNPMPVVVERKDGYLPIDPPWRLEAGLLGHKDADRTVVLVLPGDIEGQQLRLARRIRHFLVELPHLGNGGSKRLANYLCHDDAEEFVQALHPRGRLTVDGVLLAANSSGPVAGLSRTSAWRSLCRAGKARPTGRKRRARGRKAINKAQSRLDLPDDNRPDGSPA